MFKNLLACIIASGILFSWPVYAATDKLFGTNETRSTDLRPFPKWLQTLERHIKDKAEKEINCTPSALKPCHFAKWKAFVEKTKNQDLMDKITQVNTYMNESPYILDPINWGVPDYWASPYQFFVKDGDCEDYAITKYMTLRLLGFEDKDMRIVVLHDLNLGVLHAVLTVYVDGKPYVLDNQIKQVVPAAKIHHYKPIYSINEGAWWRHL